MRHIKLSITWMNPFTEAVAFAHSWLTGFRKAFGNWPTRFWYPCSHGAGRDPNSPCLSQ